MQPRSRAAAPTLIMSESTPLVGPSQETIDTVVPGDGVRPLIAPEASPRGRHLGQFSTLTLFVARMVGLGIFTTPGLVYQSVGGSPVSFVVAWLAGALIAGSGLSLYLELGLYLPRSGATKIFLEFCFPRPRLFMSVVFGVFTTVFSLSSANALVFGEYGRVVLGMEYSEAAASAIGIGLIVTAVVLHSAVARAGVALQNTVCAIKLAMFVGIAAMAVWVLAVPTSITGIHNQLLWDQLKTPVAMTPSAAGGTVLKCIYAFGGWTTAHIVQNEIKDPISTLRRTGWTAFALVVFVYAAMNCMYLVVLPHDALMAGHGDAIGAMLFDRVFGPGFLGGRLLSLFVALGALGNVLVVVYADARMIQQVAREGFLPGADILARNIGGAPTPALVLHGFVSCCVLLLPPKGDLFGYLVSIQIYPNQLFHALLAVGLYRIRRRFPRTIAPLRAPTWAVVFCFLSLSAIVLGPFVPQRRIDTGYPSYALAGWCILGALFLYWVVLMKVTPSMGITYTRQPTIQPDGLVVTTWKRQ